MLKLYFLFFFWNLILSNFNGVFGQPTLSQARTFLAATSVGKYALFAGGTVDKTAITSPSAVVDIWNSETNTWAQHTLSVARKELAATSAGKYAFFAGGGCEDNDCTCFKNRVDVWDSELNTWTWTTLSEQKRYIAAASVGTKAFFAGGTIGGPACTEISSAKVETWNNGTWSSFTLPTATTKLAAVTVNNLLLLAGGETTLGVFTDKINIYYATTDTLTSTKTLSQARHSLVAVKVGNYALFAGGVFSGGASSVVDILNTQTMTFVTGNNTLSSPKNELAATASPNKAFFGGQSSIIDVWDNVMLSWSSLVLSPQRTGLAATFVGDNALFAGGHPQSQDEGVNTINVYYAPNSNGATEGSVCHLKPHGTCLTTYCHFS